MTSLPPEHMPLAQSAVPDASGRRFWGIGFLWFVPLFGALLAPVLLGILAAQNRRHPDALVRENSRWAANWVLTVTVVAAIGAAIVVCDAIIGLVLTGESESGPSPTLLLANLLLWAAVIGHLVVSIVGVVRARTRIVNPKIAIPFIPALKVDVSMELGQPALVRETP
ncbi:hypothetical protein [Cryobacterium sp. TMB1-7]|uniref:hypothetical protein n=1 Tax=Cryobacterium sp. TMB1-7 TaxID=2555866 RepID=UPI001F541799|nr:hypothetical protein [Cryobacterium sp. TMB1-7]